MKKGNKWLSLVFLIFIQSALAQTAGRVKIVEHKEQKRFDVLINDSLFTSLLYADSLKKHLLYPVNAIGGIAVTRGYPVNPMVGDQVDHPHQIGVWLNYGDVNGADYWNNSTKIDTNKKAYGTIRVKQVSVVRTANGSSGIKVEASWLNPGAKPVISEETLYAFSEEDGVRLITRITKLTGLVDVSLKDNKEGLFGMRVSRQLEHPSDKPVEVINSEGRRTRVVDKVITTGMYESSSGISGEAVFGTRAEWLKLSGKINGKQVALVLMDHPRNVNYPAFLMSRGYGLFAMNPLGAEFYTNGKEKLNLSIKKGESLTFRHALLVGRQLSRDQIDLFYKDFKKK
ncbi:PmoA family protein [Desertivirga arenae]|uniref:DUF6807 domain-containing protein n=1 Tax=Desertivirga arenae TaxID=2810309 RepID=UPI001A95671B|nr:PmoA family protein [Pedobacter sp. SYSU D00823]